jgi:hypothetical protein
VIIHAGALYVATAGGLEGYALDAPAAPRRMWRWPIAGGVDDLAGSGVTLAVLEPDGFRILDVANPNAPSERITHRLVRVLPGLWQVDPPRCAVDLVRWLFPDRRRVGQFDGRTLVVGDLFDMVALDIARDGIVERQYTPALLPGRIREMKLQGPFVYTDTLGGFGFVVRIGDGDLSFDGIHALDGWADNAVYAGNAAYRTSWRGLEVAHAP